MKELKMQPENESGPANNNVLDYLSYTNCFSYDLCKTLIQIISFRYITNRFFQQLDTGFNTIRQEPGIIFYTQQAGYVNLFSLPGGQRE